MTMYLVEGRLNHETRGQYVLSKESAYAIAEEMKNDFPKVNIYAKENGEYKRIEKWERPMTRDEWLCSLTTEERAEENKKHGHAHIKYIAFMSWDMIDEPCSYGVNSPYCVEDINKGKVAWLYHNEAGALMVGATIEQAIEWLKKANCKWGELHE